MQTDKQELTKTIEDFIDTYYSGYERHVTTKNNQDLYIDFKKILYHDINLAETILDHPETTIKIFNDIFIEKILLENPEYKFKNTFTIRFYNIPESSKKELNKIRAKDESKLITIEGVVKLKSNLINLITHAIYECVSCGATIKIEQDITDQLKTPSACGCGRKSKFPRISEELIDFYYADIEEPLEIIDDSNKPVSIRAWFRGGLCERKIYRSILPGTKIKLHGYYKKKLKKSTKGRETPMMERYFEVISTEFLQETFEDIKYTEEDIKQFKEIAKKPDWLDYMKQQIFGDIKGHDDECKAVILQMFGGVKIKRKTGVDIRGNLHTFFVGEPGTAKSSILKIARKFAPKAKYVAGSAVSGPGLIGAVIKNEFDGSWDVQAGALSLSNKGMLMIDELDKISRENKQALHEPLSEECYHPDTLITLKNGRQKKIGLFVEDLLLKEGIDLDEVEDEEVVVDVVDKFPSYSFSDERIGFQNMNKIYCKKSPEYLYQICFSNGQEIKVTPNHPVYFFNGSQLETKRADQITPGLKVPTISSLNFEQEENKIKLSNEFLESELFQSDKSLLEKIKNYPERVDNELSELLGVISGNGKIINETIHIELKSEEAARRTKWILNKKFDADPKILFFEDSKVIMKITDKLLSSWLEHVFGSMITHHFKEKIIRPKVSIPAVFFGDKEIARFFITGVIQRESNIKKIKNKSKTFLSDLQNIFLLFNVSTKIKKEEDESYSLKILSGEETKEQTEIIGVKKIKSNTEWVYDINIPLTHNFIGTGGLLLHNTISFSKAGVDQVLPAEVSVLAAANPKYASFSKYDSLFEQIDMTTTLFNRFDLVFIFKEDPSDREHHEALGRIIMANANRVEEAENDENNTLFFKKYISYAKTFKPRMSEEVISHLSKFYSDLKFKNYNSSADKKPVPITPRNMDALRRLSQAVARSRFKEEVTLQDANIAVGFLMKSLQQLGVEAELRQDPEMMEIEIEDPVSGAKEKVMPKDFPGIIKHFIRDFMQQNPGSDGIPWDDLEALCKTKGIDEDKFRVLTEKLSYVGDIMIDPRTYKIKPV